MDSVWHISFTRIWPFKIKLVIPRDIHTMLCWVVLTNSSENLGTFRTGPCGWGEAPMPEGWNRIRAPLLFGLAGRGLFEPVAGDWVWFQCNYETNAHCRPLQRLNRIGPWIQSPRPEGEGSFHKKTHFVRIFLNNTTEHYKQIAKGIGEGGQQLFQGFQQWYLLF